MLLKLMKRPLFRGLVVAPNILAVTYFGLLASPIYQSDTQLLVKSSRKQPASVDEMLAGGADSGNQEGAFILKEYAHSWQAYNALRTSQNIEDTYTKGDIIDRYGGFSTLFQHNDVALWHYFQSMVTAEIDDKSGIVRLTTLAFTPQEAHRLAEAMLANAVSHMDQMNRAQEQDAVSVAQKRQTDLQAALANDEAQLAAYRAKVGVFDPDARYTADLQLAGGLALQESQLSAQQSAGQQTMAANPNVTALGASIGAIRQRMDQAREDAPKLAKQAAQYNELETRRENDIALLKAASLAVQEAQLKANDGRYYLSIVSTPSTPSSPELPKRLEWIAGIFLVTMLLWGLLR